MRYRAVIFAVVLSFMLAGCGKTGKFAVGFKGGTYESIVESLDDLPGLSFAAVNSQGSREIISSVNDRSTEFGIVQLDILSDVFNKGSLGVDNVKLVLPLYVEEVHLLADKKVDSIEELAGKTISVGAANSGSAGTALIILDQLGISGLVKEILFMNIDAGLESLKQGKIDAICIVSGAPVELLASLPEDFGNRFHLLVFNNERYDKVTKNKYHYQKARILADNYPWLKSDVKTISVVSSIIANSAVPGEDVCKLINTVFSNRKDLEKAHPKWMELDSDTISWYLKNRADQFHPEAKRALLPLVAE